MLLKFPKILKGRKEQPELKENELPKAGEENSEDYGLPAVNEGQISISTTGVSPADGAILVGFFINNGMSQKVKFDNVPLVLIDSEKRVLARQLFDGESIGEIAGGSSKACVVRFDEENIFDDDIPEDYKVCFDVGVKSSQIEFQSLPDNIPQEQEQKLKNILASLPEMKLGEVNFARFHIQISPQGNLLATVIIRNFSNKKINIERLPLVVFDARPKELARGQFNIEGLSLDPFKAILWTFDFGPVAQDEEIDLSNWHINMLKTAGNAEEKNNNTEDN